MGEVIKMPKKCRHSVIDKLGRKLVCAYAKHDPVAKPHRLVPDPAGARVTGDKRDASPKDGGTSP